MNALLEKISFHTDFISSLFLLKNPIDEKNQDRSFEFWEKGDFELSYSPFLEFYVVLKRSSYSTVFL
jgi:hypothetical protein